MEYKLKGNWESKKVWLDDKELDPSIGKKYRDYFPNKFSWGTANTGETGLSLLALAICLELTDKTTALNIYQKIKCDVVAHLHTWHFEKTFDFPEIKKDQVWLG